MFNTSSQEALIEHVQSNAHDVLRVDIAVPTHLHNTCYECGERPHTVDGCPLKEVDEELEYELVKTSGYKTRVHTL